MTIDPGQPATRRVQLAVLLVLTGLVALLPWMRNHAYLRDFYDYGLVIAATDKIGAGLRPYVDFATPIQAGFFWLSSIVERLGGGTYLALTAGGAALIVAMVAAFGLILARRWPWWAAGLTTLAITAASATQHTILWHNALGIFTLGLVVWTTAIAPVLAREHRWWHLLTLAGLVLGGINKLNFHLVALAAALAWALRAGLNGQARWGRVAATVLAWLVAGTAVPFAAEIAWTGASPRLWWHNVVELAATSRAGPLNRLLSTDFLSTPIHDYYGPLLLSQVGWAGLVLAVATLLGLWLTRPARGGGRVDAFLLPLAVALSGAAGGALLATNQEIAYVGLAAGLTLATGIWLGFAPEPRRGALVPALVLPATVIGVASWISAWQGQRSQFGYSPAPRAAYRLADESGATFAYLHGLHLPPEMAETLGLLERWLPEPGPEGYRPVFYGPGMEWADRMLRGVPAPRGQPLWVHWDTTYGPGEIWRLVHRLATDMRCQVVLTTLARDQWTPELAPTFARYFSGDLLGPVTRRWTRINHQTDRVVDAIQFNNVAGGNVAGPILVTESGQPLVSLPYAGQQIMLGIMGGAGRLRVAEPTYRFGADAVVALGSHAKSGPLSADFRVTVHGANPEILLWSGRVELAPGQAEAAVPFKVDAMGRNLLLQVAVPAGQTGQIMAGFRNFQISHAIEAAGGPPSLRPTRWPDLPATAALGDSLLAAVAWRPEQVVVRGGSVGDPGLELSPGGEVWLHTPNVVGEIRGRLTFAAAAGSAPTVRVVWYKGGRLQMMQQGPVPTNGEFAFHAWSGEPGGWFGILVDDGAGTAPVRAQVTTAAFNP